jgi:hypothetical protein
VTIIPSQVDGGSSDACGVVEVIFFDGQTTFGSIDFDCDNVGENNVTIRVSDPTGNSAICVAEVTVRDVTAPTFTCPDDIVLNSCLDVMPDITELVDDAADACGIASIEQNVAPGLPVGLANGANVNVIITVTDNNGNTTTCEVNVSIEDETDPYFVNCPTDVTFEVSLWPQSCEGSVIWSIPVAADDCGVVVVNQIGGPAQGQSLEAGLYEIVYQATDGNGNAVTCRFYISVIDTEGPVVVCPPNATFSTDAGVCTWTSPAGSLSPLYANANCPFEVTWTVVNPDGSSANGADDISGYEFMLGTSRITYRVLEPVSGQEWLCSFEVTVIDSEAPVIDGALCFQTYTYTTDPGECYTEQSVNLFDYASDNCTTDDELVYETSILYNGVFTNYNTNLLNLQLGVGVTVAIITVTDDSGNSSRCTLTVIVNDEEAPEITCPAGPVFERENTTDLCAYVASGGEFDAVATDQCEGVTISHNYGAWAIPTTLDGATFPVGTTVVVWTATDASGNTATCSITIIVEDTQNPEFVNCPNTVFTIGADADCSNGVIWSIPVAEDNCGIASVVETSLNGPYYGQPLTPGVYNIRYTATDIHGNTALCTFTVVIEDDSDPLIVCPPSFTVSTDDGECSWATNGSTNPLTAVDNCPDYVLTYVVTGASEYVGNGVIPVGTEFERGVSTVTYTLTDGAGNSTMCSFTVSVVDDEAPVILNCANSEPLFAGGFGPFGTTPGVCGLEAFYNVAVSDNCDAIVDVKVLVTNPDGSLRVDTLALSGGAYTLPITIEVGLTNLLIVATDGSGNVTTCLYQYEVIDTEAPVIDCPTVNEFDRDVTEGICGYVVEGTEFDVTADDNCEVVSLTHDFFAWGNPNSLDGATLPVGTTTITWTAVDEAGNSTQCVITVNVDDNEDPVFVNCPEDVTFTISLFPSSCEGSTIWSIPVATDNCDGVVVTQTAGPAQGEILEVGVYRIEYTATDLSGNSVTCEFYINVVDTEDPLIVCPANVVISENDPGECSWTSPEGSLTPLLAVANCDFEVTWTVTLPNLMPMESDMAVWNFEDITKRVVPNLPYTADAGLGVNVAPFSQVGGTFSAWVAGVGGLPNQAPNVVNWNGGNGTKYWQAIVSTVGYENLTLSSAQQSSNTGPRDFRVEYSTDNGATWFVVPGSTVTVANNFTQGVLNQIGLPAACNNQASLYLRWVMTSDISVNAGVVAAAGTSRIDNIIVTGSQMAGTVSGTGDVSGFTFPVGTSTVCYTITEIADPTMSSSCCFTVTVNDTEAPAISSALCNQTYNFATDLNACESIQEVDLTEYVTDNCTASEDLTYQTVILNPNGVLTVYNGAEVSHAMQVGVSIATITATDAYGNSSTCSLTVIVTDQQLPTIECPGSVFTRENSGDLCGYIAVGTEFDATADDNCGVVSLTHNYGAWGNPNSLDGATFPVGTTVVTWTAVDAAGNSTQCSITIVVTDDEAPTFVNCPTDVTFTISLWPDDCEGAAIWSIPIATDNCGATVTQIAGPAQGTILAVGLYTIIYQATDAAGNSVTCRFYIDVIDTEDPVIVCPGNVVISGTDPGVCTWTAPAGSLTPLYANSNCPFIVSWTVLNPNGTTNNGLMDVSGYTFALGTSTVTYTITEPASGQTWSCSFTVTVEDDEAPVLTCPPSITLECASATLNADIATWIARARATDNCDQNVDITATIFTEDRYCGRSFSRLYQFVATDDFGNTSVCFATVYVEDTTPPVISGGANNVVECVLGGAGNDSDFLAWLNTRGGATAVDGCGGLVFWTNNYNNNWITTCGNVRYTDVTFTATDECGNASSITLRFGTVDTEEPLFLNCPRPDIVVKAAPGMCGNFVNFSLPIAVDNCDIFPELRKVDTTGLTSGDMFPVGKTTLIWEAEDCSGNISTCTVYVFVNDNDQPTLECPADVVQDNDLGECGAIVNGIDPTFDDLCIDNVSLTYGVFIGGELVNSGLGSASGEFFEVGQSEVKYKVQDQPLVLISEVTQAISNSNGGTNPIPAFITNNVVSGDDYLEITNFGPATIDLGCLMIERIYNGGNDSLMIPNGTVLAAGQVLTIHFGPGTDSPANRFFNIPTAANLGANIPAGYVISLRGRVIDVVAYNGFDPNGQGLVAVVNTTDWSGSIPVVTNQGSAYRKHVWDTNTANDWALADVCELASIGSYNPVFPTAVSNGTSTTLQRQHPNMNMCTFNVTIEDVEAPVCGELDTFTYNGTGGPISASSILSRTVNVPQNFEVGRVRILNLSGTHTNVGNLVFKLTSPTGTQVILFGGLCFGGTAWNMILDDRAAGSITNSPCAPLGQGVSWAPQNGFFEFYGENSAGLWTLEVADMGSTGSGTLNNWTLELGQRLPYSQGDVVLENDPGDCGAEFMWNHPEIFDNCPGGTIELVYSTEDGIEIPNGGFVTPGEKVTEFFQVGTTKVEYILTDASGNQTICGFDVTVEDTENPVISCPADITITLGPGECRTPYSYNVTADDNCGIESIEADPPFTHFFERGNTVVTVTVTDVNGNTTTCTFTVTVRDFPNPISSLACNNTINLSLGPDCEATIGADMMLEGGPYRCYEDYIVQVGLGMPPNFVPIPTSPVVNTTHIGQQFVVVVTDPLTGNSCWGWLNVEYKTTPDFTCPPDLTLECNESLDPAFTGDITINSCVMDAVIEYEDFDQLNAKCADPRQITTRLWTVTDVFGNSASCIQTITIVRADLEDIVFPIHYNDFDLPSFTCQEVEANPALLHPDNTGRPMLGGQILRGSELCEISINYMDKIYEICGGSYEILRMWSVRNFCQPIIPGVNPRDYTQIIQVFDKRGPRIQCPDVVTVSTGFYTCDAIWVAEDNAPTILESCSDIANIRVIKPRANNRYPVGTYNIRYIVTDECGKRATCDATLRVVDQVTPTAICEKFRVASLGSDCRVRIPATAFDDGSYDNCGIVRMEVARMTTSGCYTPASQALVFRDSVDFCCLDAGATEAQRTVMFRVVDAAGLSNTCMVVVEVQDKLMPVVSCPADATVDCRDHIDMSDAGLAARFGTAVADDNCNIPAQGCNVNLTVLNSPNVDCGQGTIARIFTATDGAGNVARCTQLITLTNDYPFNGNFYRVFVQIRNASQYPTYPNGPFEDNTPAGQKVDPTLSRANLRPLNTPFPTRFDIIWPADLEVDFCGQALEPEALRNNPRFIVGSYPVFHREDICSQLGRTYDEWEFDFDAGCKKVIRQWKVIDWCQPETVLNPWMWEQVIKVIDNDGPSIVAGPYNFCITAEDCNEPVRIVANASDNCATGTQLRWDWEVFPYGDRNNPIRNNVPNLRGDSLVINRSWPATPDAGPAHIIKFVVEDGCGNKSTREVEFRIRDCKKPTPICFNGLAVDLMPSTGMADVAAVLWNAGSYDNCTTQPNLRYRIERLSQSNGQNPPSAEVLTVDCDDLGVLDVRMWVIDEYGNADYCETYVIVQNNMGADCDEGNFNITGSYFLMDEQTPVDNVWMTISTPVEPRFRESLTNGGYIYTLPEARTYTIRPLRNDNLTNGVSTTDILLIQRHILGIEPLTNPYLLIAADVDRNGRVTASDLVEIRKAILGKSTSFKNNTSWRFIDRSYVFASMEDALSPDVPSTIETGLLMDTQTGLDFIAVKVGDVNGTANAGAFTGAASPRTGLAMVLEAEDATLKAGKEYKVAIRSKDMSNILGYQFTLEFNESLVDFVGYEAGVLELTDEHFGFSRLSEGMIATSWNTAEPVNVDGEDVLFYLTFRGKGQAQLSEVLTTSSRMTYAEAVTTEVKEIAVRLEFGVDGVLAGEYELYQNQPNPFANETQIRFNLPEAMGATLTIYDVSGKVVQQIEGMYKKGMNQVQIDKSMLPATGILYYQLEAGEFRATKKMILLD